MADTVVLAVRVDPAQRRMPAIRRRLDLVVRVPRRCRSVVDGVGR
jgi:hypothetical protein